MKKIQIVKCVKSGMGFVEGEFYPIVGFNNGVQIAKTNSEGDGKIGTFQTQGRGDFYFYTGWSEEYKPIFTDHIMIS